MALDRSGHHRPPTPHSADLTTTQDPTTKDRRTGDTAPGIPHAHSPDPHSQHHDCLTTPMVKDRG